ncbi:hypothetical protein BDDG_12807 [Blastomyces dermatitidis ATCC 18188]|uniref:Uncharacterized protein n=1 Tax=Ajellomyces dermatitidis (strain ATCC 18188 / CBS 674.68) TaxID=653446 RepID=A0A0J9EQV5_AJEDA|nr:hypothetical protein BDDG_12807 [Blastomyces dermatitidis ATCC 18188]
MLPICATDPSPEQGCETRQRARREALSPPPSTRAFRIPLERKSRARALI